MNKYINKYKYMSLPLKAGIWYTLCSFFQKGISFITVPLFTRMMSTEQYGLVSLYNSWMGLLTVFLTLNLFSGGFNNAMLRYEKKRSEYTASMQGLVFTMAAFWLIIYLLFQNFFTQLFELSFILVIIMFLEIITHAALAFWSAQQRYEFKYAKVVVITVLLSVIGPVLSLIAISFSQQKGEAKIIAQSSVNIFICFLLIIYIFYKGRCFFSKIYWKSALTFNIPLVPHYLSTMVLNQADRIMISKMVGMDKAAIYSVAYSLSMILNILTNSINQAFAPWLYEKIKEKDTKEIGRTSNFLFAVTAAFLILLIILAPELILILGGREYYEAIWVIPPITASLFFIFLFQIFANVEFYFYKNKFIMYASVSGALLNIIFNYIFIKIFGYMAAGYTTLFCYVIFAIAHYIFMQKTCNNELQRAKLFDIRAIVFISIILFTALIISLFLYQMYILRYVIVVLFITVLFIKRDLIINILKDMRGKK